MSHHSAAAPFAPSRVEGASVLEIDDVDVQEATSIVANFGTSRFGYVVTANVDHAIRHFTDPHFRELYAAASLVTMDSRFLIQLLRIVKNEFLRACPGSDLTHVLFHSVIKPDDKIVVVGGTAAQADRLRTLFGLKALHHIDPPMGFIASTEAVEACLRQIEALSPFRFCFVAVGSPQQEIVAYLLRKRDVARGFALCIGASIDYITGTEVRAPVWMQQHGFEWLHRLLQNPRRMANRYLVRGPRIFALLARIEFRPKVASLFPIGDVDANIDSLELPALREKKSADSSGKIPTPRSRP